MFGFSRQIAALRRKFDGGSLIERRVAAKELAELCIIMDDPEDALPLLESMLLDPDEEVSARGRHGFMACHELAVKPLTILIAHPLSQVRARACDALASLHDEVDRTPARASLLAALADADPHVRELAAFALGKMQDAARSTIDALATMAARDPEAKTRGKALHALGNIGRKPECHQSIASHVALILTALGDELEDMRWSAAYVLENVPLPASRVLPRLLECLAAETCEWPRQRMLGVLHGVGARSDLAQELPALLALAESKPAIRRSVFSICADLAARAALAIPMLNAALADEDAESIIAARALWSITGRADAVRPWLGRMLDKPWYEASQAAHLLLEIDRDPAPLVPMLVRYLQISPEEPCGFICKHGPALAPFAGVLAPALSRAIDEYWDESDWDVMWAIGDAAAALKSSDPVVIAVLERLLAHPSDRVSSSALVALRDAGTAARPALVALRKMLDEADAEDARSIRDVIRAIEKKPN